MCGCLPDRAAVAGCNFNMNKESGGRHAGAVSPQQTYVSVTCRRDNTELAYADKTFTVYRITKSGTFTHACERKSKLAQEFIPGGVAMILNLEAYQRQLWHMQLELEGAVPSGIEAWGRFIHKTQTEQNIWLLKTILVLLDIYQFSHDASSLLQKKTFFSTKQITSYRFKIT